MQDLTKFPAPIYQETVLEPIFHAFKDNYYKEMLAINYAHGLMLVDEGIISAEEGKMLVQALLEIEETLDPAALTYTGEYEDLFFYVESELIKKLGIDVAGKLHTARSRNDINITLFKMKVKKHLRETLKELVQFQRGLLTTAKKNKEKLFIAYTHGQPAQPTTYGHYLAALIEILSRDLTRLLQAYETTDQCSMGAAAITTSGFPINREEVARLLGFAKPQENSYGCIAAVDYLLEVYSSLKILFINLGRFAQDLNFFTSFEIGYLYVPNEYVQISSIMPQKRNPVAIEHIRIQASIAAGLCDTIVNAMRNTPFADMNDAEDPIQVVGFKAFEKAKNCLKLARGFITGLQVDETKVRKDLTGNFATVTELADSLVREEGISFRAAHEITSLLVKDLLAQDKGLNKVDFAKFKKFFKEVTKKEPKLTFDRLQQFLDPNYFVKVRDRLGGPSPSALSSSLAKYQDKLAEHSQAIAALEEKEEYAKELLNKKIQKFVQTVKDCT